jgi:predicted ATPase
MELVYLWVEDYKNIHKQGFNFSPRFRCEFFPKYDKDGKLTEDSELIICDRKNNECLDKENQSCKKCNNDYEENFFGKNINVTAIVGKNGSGKSSIIKNFDGMYFQHNKSLYLYRLKNKFYSNFFEKSNKNIEKSYNDILLHLKKIYIDKLFFLNIPQDKYHDWIYEENLYRKSSKSKNQINAELFHKNILFFIMQGRCKYLKFYSPNKISIKTNLIKKTFGYLEIDLMQKINKNILKDEILKYCIYIKSIELENENSGTVKKDILNFVNTDNILEYCKTKNIDKNFNLDTKEILDFIEKISEYLNKKIELESFNKFILQKNNYNIFYYLVEIGFIGYELFDKNKSFNKLSTGEKTLFVDFCLISKEIYDITIFNNENKNIIILLEEPDLALHPQWQKEYINILIEFFKLYKNIKFHIVLTTHSPFLLSDIPQQNIIFLDTDKNGNCKVVDGLNEKKETFGANIHTLLSDSFFIEDGLMGEFAKSKINEIINFHKIVEQKRHKNCLKKIYEKRKDRFWNIQKIIGDDYLKQVVKNHLVEIEKILLGKDEAKKEEIKRVKAYLKSLEND